MFSNEPYIRFLLIFYTFFMPVEVWANIPSKPVEVRMEAQVAVSGQSVLLGDVATIYAKSIRDFEALSNLSLPAISRDKSEISLPHGYIKNRIREALPEGTDFAFFAPDVIALRRESIGISQRDFAAVILKRGRDEGRIPDWAEVEVEAVSGFDQLKLSKLADVRIDPASEMQRWKGEMSFKVSHPGKTDQQLAWVKVRVRWFAEAWVARRQINNMMNLSPADFQKSRVEITAQREDPVLATEDLGQIIGSSRARRTIVTGAPLVAGSIERAPDAKPGQPLKVVFISESGIRVTTDGALMGNGSIGAEARAKLRTSNRIVTGKLVSGNVMEVSL